LDDDFDLGDDAGFAFGVSAAGVLDFAFVVVVLVLDFVVLVFGLPGKQPSMGPASPSAPTPSLSPCVQLGVPVGAGVVAVADVVVGAGVGVIAAVVGGAVVEVVVVAVVGGDVVVGARI